MEKDYHEHHVMIKDENEQLVENEDVMEDEEMNRILRMRKIVPYVAIELFRYEVYGVKTILQINIPKQKLLDRFFL